MRYNKRANQKLFSIQQKKSAKTYNDKTKNDKRNDDDDSENKAIRIPENKPNNNTDRITE